MPSPTGEPPPAQQDRDRRPAEPETDQPRKLETSQPRADAKYDVWGLEDINTHGSER